VIGPDAKPGRRVCATPPADTIGGPGVVVGGGGGGGEKNTLGLRSERTGRVARRGGGYNNKTDPGG